MNNERIGLQLGAKNDGNGIDSAELLLGEGGVEDIWRGWEEFQPTFTFDCVIGTDFLVFECCWNLGHVQ